jgi:ribonucleoside-diphosphate reductase alpha chain
MSDKNVITSKIIGWKVADEEIKTNVTPVKQMLNREPVLSGKTYTLKTQLVKHTLYITINKMWDNDLKKFTPFEIFFNTRDTSKFVELQIITRLLSAIFRRNEDSTFVIKELKAVANPENTGYFRPPRQDKGETKGKYIPSLFYEIGEIIEEYMSTMNTDNKTPVKQNVTKIVEPEVAILETGITCPSCYEKTLRREGGCDMCTACGYSKCG